jgi:purine-binding chemotaxis protein CheW
MDILAARKKAAEKAKSRQEPEPASQAGPGPADASPCEPAPAMHAAETAAPDAQPLVPAAQPPAQAASETTVPEAPAQGETPRGEDAKETSKEIELLSFRLGGEEYAVLVDDVREVLKIRELTAVPNTPEYILGVISLRGTMLTVIDLGKRLNLTPGARDDRARIIVVSPDDEDVGLLVDRVTGVLKIMPEGIKPPPENVERGAEYLRGIVRKDDRLVILLDLTKAVGV